MGGGALETAPLFVGFFCGLRDSLVFVFFWGFLEFYGFLVDFVKGALKMGRGVV